jgi:hypothetical protein
MQVSCKVSYSVLIYLEKQGAQLDAFFESSDSPVEYLKDPSGWLDLFEMENFLSELALHLSEKNPEAFYREIGQNNFELRAWGVLDSVLKMVESPKDILGQPDRFLSYFLTPHPEFDIQKKSDDQILLTMKGEPIVKHVFAYLMGAVEGLPLYMGLPLAHIQHISGRTYSITWNDDQESLFDEQEKKRRQFHPEIVQSVMQKLQVSPETTSSDVIASEAFERMVAIEVEKRMEAFLSRQKEFDETFFKVKNDFFKMYDYFTRAQQIITLISPTARKASVKEAMRRVDWEYVQKEFPAMVEDACDSILSLREAYNLPQESSSKTKMREESPARPDDNDFLELQGGPHV